MAATRVISDGAEDPQLSLVKAFTKIKNRQTRQEVIEFVETALEFEET
jgi:hypothetical protein